MQIVHQTDAHVLQKHQPDGLSGLDSVQKAMESVQRKMAVYEGSLLQVLTQPADVCQLHCCLPVLYT